MPGWPGQPGLGHTWVAGAESVPCPVQDPVCPSISETFSWRGCCLANRGFGLFSYSIRPVCGCHHWKGSCKGLVSWAWDGSQVNRKAQSLSHLDYSVQGLPFSLTGWLALVITSCVSFLSFTGFCELKYHSSWTFEGEQVNISCWCIW